MTNKFNDTLNLPKTDFKMKANLYEREPKILEFWKEHNIYDKIMHKNSSKKKYILHDGPPYANGNIHLGHALNKILKDIIVKFKNMSGFKAPFVPGWDTHGLPTELKAQAKKGTSYSKSDLNLRQICKETALEYLDIQREEFKRLGVFADWENPYVTLDQKFESKQIEVFAKMADKGAIYRGLKPVHWCLCCKTALAEAEIEYKEDDCDSIFVKFKLKEEYDNESLFIKKVKEFNVDLSKIYIIIWTTTIWTLPANMAVCLNSSFEYSLVKHNDEYYILAKNLISKVFSKSETEPSIIFSLKGIDFENLKFEHPFLDRDSKLILGNHVTLESGTGCVHTAPGHGIEDFEICKKYDIPIIVPVNENGVLTHEAGMFAGLSLEDSNKKIKETLENNKLLFSSKNIKHKYPHCWRCKMPVIFRATRQWFCSVDKFKNDALKEIEKVKWMPSWGKDRISQMIQERSDWCISRQRRWGVPIPVIYCLECGEAILDYEFIMNVSKIFETEGSNIWYNSNVDMFLTSKLKCGACGHTKFEKEQDIMDVWFDSGTSYKSVLQNDEFPADLYLEGSDQHRGWFQSSLLTCVCSQGQAPYKGVLTHGWVVDDHGRKQSKSLGNVISPQDVIKSHGADILRLWVSSVDYVNDVKISQNILSQVSEFYRKFRNTARFILGNINDFNPKDDYIDPNNFLPIDKWIINKFNIVYKKCISSYENFEFHIIFHLIGKFCINDLSNFYLDVIKDRLYVSRSKDKSRKSAQNTIYIILKSLVKIVAPILSFTAEEIWGFLPNENIESVFLSDFDELIDLKVNQDFIEKWDLMRNICDDVKKNLEEARALKIIGSSLEACVIFYATKKDFEFINENLNIIKDLLIISEVKVVNSLPFGKILENHKNIGTEITKASGKKCERCWMYDESVEKSEIGICERCTKILN